MNDVLVEACVTTVEEAVACAAAGAHRLELCRELEVGGLTPDLAVLEQVKSAVEVPVFAMARPRGGPFVFWHDLPGACARATPVLVRSSPARSAWRRTIPNS